jgi:hypothetical protein
MTDIDRARQVWHALSDQMADEFKGVERGKMMSADALTYAGKVFVFFSTKGGGTGLGCRLGRDYPFDQLKLSQIRHLAPFKTKPPMKDWILVDYCDADRWHELVRIALEIAQQNGK